MAKELKPIDVSKYHVTRDGNVIRTDNNDKEKNKFAIRYLKYGLKSKRTPPLYERLMNELGFVYIDKRIAELEKENAELKRENLSNKCDISNLIERVGKAEKENGKARRIIKNIIRVTWGEGWNYSLDFKVEAEDFIKE